MKNKNKNDWSQSIFPQLESVVGENGGNLEVEFISLYQSLQKVVRMGLELNPWIEVITVQKKNICEYQISPTIPRFLLQLLNILLRKLIKILSNTLKKWQNFPKSIQTRRRVSLTWDPVCPVALGQQLFKINEIWVTFDRNKRMDNGWTGQR